jgi:hypothetical protein
VGFCCTCVFGVTDNDKMRKEGTGRSSQFTRRPLPTAPVCSSVRLPSLGDRRSGPSFYRCVRRSTVGAKRDRLLDSPEPDQSIPIPPRSKEKRRGRRIRFYKVRGNATGPYWLRGRTARGHRTESPDAVRPKSCRASTSAKREQVRWSATPQTGHRTLVGVLTLYLHSG